MLREMDRQQDTPWTPDTGPDANETRWLSASGAATVLGVNQRTIRRAIARGELPARKRSGIYHIAPADLARYGARRRRTLLPEDRLRVDPPRLVPFPVSELVVAPKLPRQGAALIGRQEDVAA